MHAQPLDADDVVVINGIALTSLARTDFGWPELRTVGEFDGKVKYGRLLKPGQDPGSVVFEEKRPEDAIRDLQLQVVRWVTADLNDPTRLIGFRYDPPTSSGHGDRGGRILRGMLIKEARAAAADWVRRTGGAAAFVTGSALDLADHDELSADSDIDVVVVADGPVPAKIGKVVHDGVRLDVSFIAAAELADTDAVARTHYLAPSFAKSGIVVDDGRLRALVERIAPTFAEPTMIMSRVEDVVARMDSGLAGVGRPGTWAEQLQGWIFPISLPTQVFLVAGLRTPTVRLRYLRARDLLTDRHRPELYEELLDRLGCRTTPATTVHDHLADLDAAFTAAVHCAETTLPFASDLTEAMRDSSVGATQRLVTAGHHREAVFWLMVTFLRCQLVLEQTRAPEADRTEAALRLAADQLLDVRTTEDLRTRADQLVAATPVLRAAARSLILAA